MQQRPIAYADIPNGRYRGIWRGYDITLFQQPNGKAMGPFGALDIGIKGAAFGTFLVVKGEIVQFWDEQGRPFGRSMTSGAAPNPTFSEPLTRDQLGSWHLVGPAPETSTWEWVIKVDPYALSPAGLLDNHMVPWVPMGPASPNGTIRYLGLVNDESHPSYPYNGMNDIPFVDIKDGDDNFTTAKTAILAWANKHTTQPFPTKTELGTRTSIFDINGCQWTFDRLEGSSSQLLADMIANPPPGQNYYKVADPVQISFTFPSSNVKDADAYKELGRRIGVYADGHRANVVAVSGPVFVPPAPPPAPPPGPPAPPAPPSPPPAPSPDVQPSEPPVMSQASVTGGSGMLPLVLIGGAAALFMLLRGRK